VSKKIERNYLEINSLNDLKETRLTQNGFSFEKVEPENFQINKFFYKNVGRKHHWVDRLVWTDKNWIDYTTDNKVKTFIVKKHDDLVGYFELIYHEEQNEVEIAYLGLLEEYHNKKIGSLLLSTAIKNAFLEKPQRVWVHTCSLDHKNALKNYIARGMKIFKKETVFV
jgi:ribosomal protein S18 acetylase RimI-like enzyme